MSNAGAFDNNPSGSMTIDTITGNTGGPIGPDGADNINIVGAGGVNVAGNAGTNTLTITVAGMGFTWNVITSATNPNQIVEDNGYITKGAGAVTLVLPAAANIGDTFVIAGYGNLWTLTQNALQSITLGAKTTLAGIGGSITATNIKDTIEVICVTTNTEFQIIDSVGNLTFV
jgi:hypothetical protein